jgi:hypothetical protein
MTSGACAWRSPIGQESCGYCSIGGGRQDTRQNLDEFGAAKAGGILNISFQPGEPFNPYRMFTGLFVPEGLAC